MALVKCALLTSLLLVSCGTELSAAGLRHDSTAIFVTRQQFDKDSGAFFCHCKIQEKETIFWDEFYYSAQGRVRIKEDNGEQRIFTPGSIVGFSANGIKFIYLPTEEMYFAELGNIANVNFFMTPSTKMIYVGYVNPKTGRLRKLTRKHVMADFRDDRFLLPKLLLLNKSIMDYFFFSFRKKDFLAYKHIISRINN
jgi:hypothetical protein